VKLQLISVASVTNSSASLDNKQTADQDRTATTSPQPTDKSFDSVKQCFNTPDQNTIPSENQSLSSKNQDTAAQTMDDINPSMDQKAINLSQNQGGILPDNKAETCPDDNSPTDQAATGNLSTGPGVISIDQVSNSPLKHQDGDSRTSQDTDPVMDQFKVNYHGCICAHALL